MTPASEGLIISDEAKRSTEKCHTDFACLKGTPLHCKVEQFLGAELLVCAKKDDCPYKLSYGDGYFCTCPVRKDIYKRYRI